MATYTGVLLSATAIPVWYRGRRHLPAIFALSATSTGCALQNGLLALGGGSPSTSRKVEVIETVAGIGEALLLLDYERVAGVPGKALFGGTRGRRLKRVTLGLGLAVPALMALPELFGRHAKRVNPFRALVTAACALTGLRRPCRARLGRRSAGVPPASGIARTSHGEPVRQAPYLAIDAGCSRLDRPRARCGALRVRRLVRRTAGEGRHTRRDAGPDSKRDADAESAPELDTESVPDAGARSTVPVLTRVRLTKCSGANGHDRRNRLRRHLRGRCNGLRRNRERRARAEHAVVYRDAGGSRLVPLDRARHASQRIEPPGDRLTLADRQRPTVRLGNPAASI